MSQNRNVPFVSPYTYHDIIRLLTLFEWDATEGIWWRHVDDELLFFVNCNDVFAWATADCEKIYAEDIIDLENAFDDTLAADPDSGSIYFANLWVARKRNMRPQNAYFSYIPKKLTNLFENAGPERVTSLDNPKDHL